LLPWHIVSWPEGDFRTISPRDALPLIGRPFVLGHYDCWGLVMSYYWQEHGIELKDYRVDYPWWEDSYPDNFYQDCWYECGFREIDGPLQPGDMVIMQVQSNNGTMPAYCLKVIFYFIIFTVISASVFRMVATGRKGQ
jgi:cell wall-associated NlpC family hydrolase